MIALLLVAAYIVLGFGTLSLFMVLEDSLTTWRTQTGMILFWPLILVFALVFIAWKRGISAFTGRR